MSDKKIGKVLEDLLLLIADSAGEQVTVNSADLNTLVDAYERTSRLLDILIVHDGNSFVCKDCHNISSRLELANRVCEEKPLCSKCGGWKFISTDEISERDLIDFLNKQRDGNSEVRFPVKVIWSNLGEIITIGVGKEESKDVEVLRFSVHEWKNEQWTAVEDASYCTNFPVSATPEQRLEGLRFLMDEVFEPLKDGHSIKKLCERLSWIGLREGIPTIGSPLMRLDKLT